MMIQLTSGSRGQFDSVVSLLLPQGFNIALQSCNPVLEALLQGVFVFPLDDPGERPSKGFPGAVDTSAVTEILNLVNALSVQEEFRGHDSLIVQSPADASDPARLETDRSIVDDVDDFLAHGGGRRCHFHFESHGGVF